MTSRTTAEIRADLAEQFKAMEDRFTALLDRDKTSGALDAPPEPPRERVDYFTPRHGLPIPGWKPAPAGTFAAMWFCVPGLKPIKVGG